MENRPFRIVNWVMVALFAVSVVVQLNDPDPWRWIAIYGAASAACLLARPGRAGWLAPAIVAIAPRTLPNLVIRDLVKPMQEKTPAIEESRELLGLVIISVWMGVLVLARARLERRRRTGS